MQTRRGVGEFLQGVAESPIKVSNFSGRAFGLALI